MARPPMQSRRVGDAAETRSDALLREPEVVRRMAVRREGERLVAELDVFRPRAAEPFLLGFPLSGMV
jgi:hypothetical protein